MPSLDIVWRFMICVIRVFQGILALRAYQGHYFPSTKSGKSRIEQYILREQLSSEDSCRRLLTRCANNSSCCVLFTASSRAYVCNKQSLIKRNCLLWKQWVGFYVFLVIYILWTFLLWTELYCLFYYFTKHLINKLGKFRLRKNSPWP